MRTPRRQDFICLIIEISWVDHHQITSLGRISYDGYRSLILYARHEELHDCYIKHSPIPPRLWREFEFKMSTFNRNPLSSLAFSLLWAIHTFKILIFRYRVHLNRWYKSFNIYMKRPLGERKLLLIWFWQKCLPLSGHVHDRSKNKQLTPSWKRVVSPRYSTKFKTLCQRLLTCDLALDTSTGRTRSLYTYSQKQTRLVLFMNTRRETLQANFIEDCILGWYEVSKNFIFSILFIIDDALEEHSREEFGEYAGQLAPPRYPWLMILNMCGGASTLASSVLDSPSHTEVRRPVFREWTLLFHLPCLQLLFHLMNKTKSSWIVEDFER